NYVRRLVPIISSLSSSPIPSLPLPTHPPPQSTLFPYTTLFRSPEYTESVSQILDAATPLFAEHGFNGVTTRQVAAAAGLNISTRSEEHTSELQSRENLVCRLLLEKKNKIVAANRMH